MEPKVIRTEIKVARTMVTVLVGLLVALALLAMPSAGAHPPLEGPGGQGGVTVASSVPTMISYQGQLLDSGGNPVPDGTYSMTFKLYDVPSGGTAFWEETHPSVQVTDGLFNVLLGGGGNPLVPSDFTGTTYLGVTVDGVQEMTPRQQVVSVGYAFRAETAELCLQPDSDWDYDTNPPHMYSIPTGNVGIGTTAPEEKLDVKGHVRFYDATYPESYALFENNWITLNEHRNRNKLWISAYDSVYGNLIYTEDPQEGSGQGFGIAGGSRMAPFDRFVVNTDEMFLGYSILPGNGESSTGGAGSGNLYVRGNVGIGTTAPQNKLDVAGAVAIGTDYSGTATAPADGMIIEGKVGIGTASVDANAKFEVEGGRVYITDNYPTLTFNNEGDTGPDISIASSDFNPSAGDFMIYQTSPATRRILSYYLSGPKLALMADVGNVGIGTDEPQSTLQVEGDPGYLQIDSINVSPPVPPPADCSVLAHIGRMILTYDDTSSCLCVCKPEPLLGWSCVPLP